MIAMKQLLAAPVVSRDFAFFYDGLKARQLLVQLCDSCGHRRHPPGPMCPKCRSLAWTAVPVSERGTVYSFVVHHYPVFPDYGSPHAVALVQLEGDVRIVGALFGIDPEKIHMGMEVQARFAEHEDGFVFHYFVPGEV